MFWMCQVFPCLWNILYILYLSINLEDDQQAKPQAGWTAITCSARNGLFLLYQTHLIYLMICGLALASRTTEANRSYLKIGPLTPTSNTFQGLFHMCAFVTSWRNLPNAHRPSLDQRDFWNGKYDNESVENFHYKSMGYLQSEEDLHLTVWATLVYLVIKLIGWM